MGGNEDIKSDGPGNPQGNNGEDIAGATEDAPSKSARESLGKSKSMPALKRASPSDNTRISHSESSFAASLKLRSIVPEEREVRRFGEVKVVRTLSQLVGSEHSFVEEDGAGGEEDTGGAPRETQVGDTLSSMDFPSTIGTDTKLDAELRQAMRSAETVGEGKTEEALVVTRLQGEATVAPTTFESSVGEPQIAKVLSDAQREKKRALADEGTVYTSFSDSSTPKPEADLAKLPFQSEGAEQEAVLLVAPGTSHPDVAKSIDEEAQKPVPFKTPEETTVGSEVEDTLVERAGLAKQAELKAPTRLETIEPRGDWEGPAEKIPAEETAVTKQPPKRRVSTQVSESQASEWRVVEHPKPYGGEQHQALVAADEASQTTSGNPTNVGLPKGPPTAELRMEVDITVDTKPQVPAHKKEHIVMEIKYRETPEPTPITVDVTAHSPELQIKISEVETTIPEAKATSVAKDKERKLPAAELQAISTESKEPEKIPAIKMSSSKEPSNLLISAAHALHDEAPPKLPEPEPSIPISAPVERKIRRRSSVLPPTSSLVPWYKSQSQIEEITKKPAALESQSLINQLGAPQVSKTAGIGKVKESHSETAPVLQSFSEAAPLIPSHEGTTPHIESFAPAATVADGQGEKRKYSETKMVPQKDTVVEQKESQLEPLPPPSASMIIRRRSSVMPPTAAVVPGYRRKSSGTQGTKTSGKEPTYIETTPVLEWYPQEAPPIPSYVEKTPHTEVHPQVSAIDAMKRLSEPSVSIATLEEPMKVEPQLTIPTPAPVAKIRRRSSVVPPTAYLVPWHKSQSQLEVAIEKPLPWKAEGAITDLEAPELSTASKIGTARESHIETTPAPQSYPQETPPIPSYLERTPHTEVYPQESAIDAMKRHSEPSVSIVKLEGPMQAEPQQTIPTAAPVAKKIRRRSSVVPPTAALVPWYKSQSQLPVAIERPLPWKAEGAITDLEAPEVSTASKMGTGTESHIETTPALESLPQEVPPPSSYEEPTPGMEPVPLASVGTEVYRRRSSAKEGSERELSYIEKTPALESFPQEAPPIPSYDETTPYKVRQEDAVDEKEAFQFEASPRQADTMKMRRRSSVLPPTAAIVPGYRRKSSDKEGAEKQLLYTDTTRTLESIPQEAPPLPSNDKTTHYMESFAPAAIATDDQEPKRKRSETKTVQPEDAVDAKEVFQFEASPRQADTMKIRRRSSVVPPTAALVPGYRRKSSGTQETKTSGKEPTYIETTPVLEYYPQEAPPIPSSVDTTPYTEAYPQEIPIDAMKRLSEPSVSIMKLQEPMKVEPQLTIPTSAPVVKKIRRRSSVMPPTAALVPWYKSQSQLQVAIEKPLPWKAEGAITDLEAPEVSTTSKIGTATESHIETTPALQSCPQETPPIPSYVERTPHTEVCPQEIAIDTMKRLSEPSVSIAKLEEPMQAEPKQTIPTPSPVAKKIRRRSSVVPPTAYLVPWHKSQSQLQVAIEKTLPWKAEGAITDLEAREVSTASKMGTGTESHIETTPALESLPQEAPPPPSYEEPTAHIGSFAPTAIVTDDQRMKRKISEVKMVRQDSLLGKGAPKVEPLPPPDATLKMRRRSSIMPPTAALVPWHERKSSIKDVKQATQASGATGPKALDQQETALMASSEETAPCVEGLPSAAVAAEAKALGASVPLAESRALELRHRPSVREEASVVHEWALVELKPRTGSDVAVKEQTQLDVADHQDAQGRVVPAFGTDESVGGPLVAVPTTPKKKHSFGGIFSHSSQPDSAMRSRRVSEVTGLKYKQAATQPEGADVTVTLRDYEADLDEQPSSAATQSSQEEEEPGTTVRKDKSALTLYDEKAPTVLLAAKKQEGIFPPDAAHTKPGSLKPEVKESQPFVPRSDETSSLVELALPRAPKQESATVRAEQPLSGGEFLPATQKSIGGEKAAKELKPAEAIPAELKPAEAASGPPEPGVCVTVLTPKHGEPFRGLAGMPVIAEPTNLTPRAGAIERTHHISAPWASRSRIAAAEEATRGRAAWEKELTRATALDRRIERLHEKKTAKYSVLIKDGQPIRSISSSSDCTEPVKEDFSDLAYQYVASEEQVLERIVTVDGTKSTNAAPYPPLDKHPPGAGTKDGGASEAHTASSDSEPPKSEQTEQPPTEERASESQFKSEEAPPSTQQSSSFEIGIPVEEQTEFPITKDHHTDEITTDTGFEEFASAHHEDRARDADSSALESSTAVESGEHLPALEYRSARVDTHSATNTPFGVTTSSRVMEDGAKPESLKAVPKTKASEKHDTMIKASQVWGHEQTHLLTIAPKTIVPTTEHQELELSSKLPQLEYIPSQAAVAEEKPKTKSELTVPVLLLPQKIEDKTQRGEIDGQPKMAGATVARKDGLQSAPVELVRIKPTCPPQPVIAVEEEIPVLDACPESFQQPTVQVSALEKPPTKLPADVYPTAKEHEALTALDKLSTLEEKPTSLKAAEHRPPVEYHAPLHLKGTESKEVPQPLTGSQEMKISHKPELPVSEVVPTASKASVSVTVPPVIEAPSILANTAQAEKQRDAVVHFFDETGGVDTSQSQQAPLVKKIPSEALDEQARLSEPKEPELEDKKSSSVPILEAATTRPVEKGVVITSDATASKEHVRQTMATVASTMLVPWTESAPDELRTAQGTDRMATESERASVEATIGKRSVPPDTAVAGRVHVMEAADGEYANRAASSQAALPTEIAQRISHDAPDATVRAAEALAIPGVTPLLEPYGAKHGAGAEQQRTQGEVSPSSLVEKAAVGETEHKSLEPLGTRLAIEHRTTDAGTEQMKHAASRVTAVEDEITRRHFPENKVQALVKSEVPGTLVGATHKESESVVSISEPQVTEMPLSLTDTAPAAGTVEPVTRDRKLQEIQYPKTERALPQKPSTDVTSVTEQHNTEMMHVLSDVVPKSSQTMTLVEPRSLSPTDQAQRHQASQLIEVPSTEVRSAGDYSSEGGAVLVGVEDVDEHHEYHEEVREKRSTSIASLLKESPATIMAHLSVASSKPDSPGEIEGAAVLEPMFQALRSEEELQQLLTGGTITELSTVPEEVTKSFTDATEATITGHIPASRQASAPDLEMPQKKEQEAAISEVSDGVADKPLALALADKPPGIERVAKQAVRLSLQGFAPSTTPSSHLETALPKKPPTHEHAEEASERQTEPVVLERHGELMKTPTSKAALEKPIPTPLPEKPPAILHFKEAAASKIESAVPETHEGTLKMLSFKEAPPKAVDVKLPEKPPAIEHLQGQADRRAKPSALQKHGEIAEMPTSEAVLESPIPVTLPDKPPAIEYVAEKSESKVPELLDRHEGTLELISSKEAPEKPHPVTLPEKPPAIEHIQEQADGRAKPSVLEKRGQTAKISTSESVLKKPIPVELPEKPPAIEHIAEESDRREVPEVPEGHEHTMEVISSKEAPEKSILVALREKPPAIEHVQEQADKQAKPSVLEARGQIVKIPTSEPVLEKPILVELPQKRQAIEHVAEKSDRKEVPEVPEGHEHTMEVISSKEAPEKSVPVALREKPPAIEHIQEQADTQAKPSAVEKRGQIAKMPTSGPVLEKPILVELPQKRQAIEHVAEKSDIKEVPEVPEGHEHTMEVISSKEAPEKSVLVALREKPPAIEHIQEQADKQAKPSVLETRGERVEIPTSEVFFKKPIAVTIPEKPSAIEQVAKKSETKEVPVVLGETLEVLSRSEDLKKTFPAALPEKSPAIKSIQEEVQREAEPAVPERHGKIVEMPTSEEVVDKPTPAKIRGKPPAAEHVAEKASESPMTGVIQPTVESTKLFAVPPAETSSAITRTEVPVSDTSTEPAVVKTPSLIETDTSKAQVPAEVLESRKKSISSAIKAPVGILSQEKATLPASEPHVAFAPELSQEEPVPSAVPEGTGSLAMAQQVTPHAQTIGLKPGLTEEPVNALAKKEQVVHFPTPGPTSDVASLKIAEPALQSAGNAVEEKVREAAAVAEREPEKVDEEKEAVPATVPAPAIQVPDSVSAVTGGVLLPRPLGQLVAVVPGGSDGMRADAPGITESELAIADALRVSEQEARSRDQHQQAHVQGIIVEAPRPQLEQHEAETIAIKNLARPPLLEREIDQAHISSTALPPSETTPYAEFQKSLKAPPSTTLPSAAAMASKRLTPDYAVTTPVALSPKAHAEIGKDATEMEPALQQPLVEKSKNEIRELAAAAVVVAAASAAVNAQQQREMAVLREASIAGSLISAASEASCDVSQKIAGDLDMLPSASRTALVAVLAAEPLVEPDIPNAICGPPSAISSSASGESVDRLRQDSSRDRSEELRVPELLVPALDDEISLPRPTSFNVPVINIQYNFHFPSPSDAPGSSGRQPPPSAERAMAAQVLRGALAQQGMAGHIPGHHILTPEQAAIRQITDRLNDVAQRGTEPYTGRQSPGRSTIFHRLPRKPVPPVPGLQPPGGDMEAQERKRLSGFRFIVCLIAFLMVVFILLYCLGLIGNRRYFMYYG